MRRRNEALILSFLFIFAGCSPFTSIQRDILPDQRPEAEILNSRTALIRTADADISLVSLTRDQWKYALSSRALTGTYGIEPQEELPFDIFFFTLTNSTELLLSNVTVSCSYADKLLLPVKAETFFKTISLPSREKNKISDILSVRRLTTFDFEFDKINFEKDTLLYPFSFILPLDRICFLTAFPPIPKDMRHFTVTISYSTPTAKKKVDFRFTRFEHREEE